MVTKGDGGDREINQEFRINVYILLYIEQITNKDLPCSTGNYIQYFVINHNGKESEKGIYIYINIYLHIGEGNGNPPQYSCLENPMDGGAWQGAVHGVEKSRTQLSDFTFTFHFHALEKEMATHSSVLAWRIPGMGEPGVLQSMGSHSQTRLK